MSSILTFKDNRSKWLFMAILLLSFFTYSGIVIKSRAKPYTQQSTLVANKQTSLSKVISYKRSLLQVYNSYSTLSIFTISTFDISRMYSRQVCTCINELSASYKSRPQTVFFYPVKTCPKNLVDYPATALG